MWSGSVAQVVAASCTELSRNEPPAFSPFSTSYLSTYEGTWHATKSGVVTREGEVIGRSPKRRCDEV